MCGLRYMVSISLGTASVMKIIMHVKADHMQTSEESRKISYASDDEGMGLGINEAGQGYYQRSPLTAAHPQRNTESIYSSL